MRTCETCHRVLIADVECYCWIEREVNEASRRALIRSVEIADPGYIQPKETNDD